MSALRSIEQPLQTWRSFADIARATRTLSAAATLRWAECVRQAETFAAWTGRLRAAYRPPRAEARLHVVLAVGTDHGLCGSLNRRIAEAHLDAHPRPTSADLAVTVGARLIPLVEGRDVLRLPAPSSFEAAETLAGQLERLIVAQCSATGVEVVATHARSVEPDGTPIVHVEPLLDRVTPSPDASADADPTNPHPGAVAWNNAPAELTSVVAGWTQCAALHLRAMLIVVLCRAAAAESEVRWRAMNRAHDGAVRKIEALERRVRTARQEIVTQEMLELRQSS